jgi:hypothetical protein
MRAFLFLSADFLRANLRQALTIFVWILSVGLVLSSATALWALPLYPAAKETQPHRLFFLTLSPLLSEAGDHQTRVDDLVLAGNRLGFLPFPRRERS